MPEAAGRGLVGPWFARGEVAAEVSDEAWLRAMIDVEAAFARASGHPAVADAILAAEVSVDELAVGTGRTGSPLGPLVDRLRAQAGPEVHRGATSQDIIDTATMLVLGRALRPLLADCRAAADAAARLAVRHRTTPVVGRTLLQHAPPTSFGLRAARWMVSIDDACRWLEDVHDHDSVVDLGGPAGHADPSLASALADELGLGDPVLAWHATRLRPVRFASALGGLCGTLGKVARDVSLLAQPEIAELREGDPNRGGSASIAGKDNPIASITVLMCTRRVPALLTTVFAAMESEHERGAGTWQVEWATTTELLRLAGSAAAWARDMLEHLQVDEARMTASAGVAPDLGAAAVLVDRALRARRT